LRCYVPDLSRIGADDFAMNVTQAARQGATLGIVGESGSGKSTLAKAIVQLVPLAAGSVRFDRCEAHTMRGRDLKEVRRRVQLIYQDPYCSLNPRLSIEQAISEPAVVHGFCSARGAHGRALEVLAQVGLPAAVATRRPVALSGGQRQRVAIARALAARPDILVADEAASALDVSVQAQILNLFTDLQHELGLSMLFISHALSVVTQIADRVAVMYLGRIVEVGPATEIFQRPAHPYTAALLRAQPGRHRREAAGRAALSGEIPSALNIPQGCRFRSRCPMAQQICAEVDPAPVALSGMHISYCHFARDGRPARSEVASRTPADV
jgi:oligopeptide transport system ATP-binding protein